MNVLGHARLVLGQKRRSEHLRPRQTGGLVGGTVPWPPVPRPAKQGGRVEHSIDYETANAA